MGLRLCAFGESTVNGTGDPEHLGWIGRALAGRRDVTLSNLGIRRETSRELAARWRAEAGLRWTEAKPMRLLFSFGLNDCTPGAAQGVRVSADQAVANARAILEAARALAPTLMIGPPPPADPAVRAAARTLNPRLALTSADVGVPYIDVFARLEAEPVWMAEVAEWDGAHPGAAGYARLAAIVTADPAWQGFLT